MCYARLWASPPTHRTTNIAFIPLHQFNPPAPQPAQTASHPPEKARDKRVVVQVLRPGHPGKRFVSVMVIVKTASDYAKAVFRPFGGFCRILCQSDCGSACTAITGLQIPWRDDVSPTARPPCGLQEGRGRSWLQPHVSPPRTGKKRCTTCPVPPIPIHTAYKPASCFFPVDFFTL